MNDRLSTHRLPSDLPGSRPPVLALDRLTWPDAVTVAGAKLARLALLGRAGLRVPAGFAVTAGAFARHLEHTGLAALVPALLATATDPRDHTARAAASAELRRLVRATGPGAELRDRVLAGYAELGAGRGTARPPVAVRSSAVAEDGADHSFAGAFESFLDVRGPEALLEAVRDCWASLFTHRALAYRAHAGLPHDALGMAVGVMEMVPARASGVAFSLHPVTGSRDRVVIESAPGPGGAVAGDGTTPERTEVGKSDGRVLRHSGPGHRPLLSAAETGGVVEAVCRAEEVLGHPVDLEWAVDGNGGTWVLQARPVTGTAAVAEPPAGGDDTGWDPTLFLLGL